MTTTQTPTAQEQLLQAVAGGAEVNNESRKLLHKLGLWGTANSINQNHGLTAALVQKQFGAGGVSPEQISKLMDTVPFGGVVSITNIGTQPSEAPQQPSSPAPPPPGAVDDGIRFPPQPIQPTPITQRPTDSVAPAPASSSFSKLLATGLLAGLAGAAGVGIPAAFLMNRPAAKPNPGINGELELEIPFNVKRRSEQRTTTDSSKSSTKSDTK